MAKKSWSSNETSPEAPKNFAIFKVAQWPKKGIRMDTLETGCKVENCM